MSGQWYLTPIPQARFPRAVQAELWFRRDGVRYAVIYWLNTHGQIFFDVREEKFLTPCDEATASEH